MTYVTTFENKNILREHFFHYQILFVYCLPTFLPLCTDTKPFTDTHLFQVEPKKSP